jgi:putative spermidine/putrescine transport system substrate-binding protein
MAPRDPNKLFRYLRWLDYRDRMQRRRFLKMMAMAGVGAVGAKTLAACADDDDDAAPPAATDDDADDAEVDTDDTDDTAVDDDTDDVADDDIDYTDVAGYDQDDRWAGRTIVVTDFGGAMRDIWRTVAYDPFSQLTGCEIIEDTSDSALLRSQVESGNVEWSMSQQGGSTGILLGQQGMLEELDYDVIERDGLVEGIAGEHTVACLFWSTIIAYNTESFPDDPPGGWADFWDLENVPGARGLYDWPVPNLEFALIADGVPMDELYPLDVDRAFESLDRIKDDILVWWDAGAQPPQLVSDGELDMCTAWNGRITAAQDEGNPIDIQWNEGSITFDTFTVPRGAPEPEVAMDLINFMSRPEVQARMAMLIPYGPVHNDAFDMIPDDILATLPSSPELMEVQFERNIEYWLENEDEILERWQSWLLD